jgi:hypothetical protein
MSGPIVRTGTTPEFWKNWDRVFGGKTAKKAAAGGKKAAKKTAKSPAGKSPKTKAAKKVARKKK